jgi:hypothetical protein
MGRLMQQKSLLHRFTCGHCQFERHRQVTINILNVRQE